MIFSALFIHLLTFIDDLVIPTQIVFLTVEMLYVTTGSLTAGQIVIKGKRVWAAIGESGVPSQSELVIMYNFDAVLIIYVLGRKHQTVSVVHRYHRRFVFMLK